MEVVTGEGGILFAKRHNANAQIKLYTAAVNLRTAEKFIFIFHPTNRRRNFPSGPPPPYLFFFPFFLNRR